MTNLIEWIVENKLAKNNFSAAHIANGLRLAGVDETEQKRRVEQYRLWRRATKDTPAMCYEYVLTSKEPPQEMEAIAGTQVPSTDELVICSICESPIPHAVRIETGEGFSAYRCLHTDLEFEILKSGEGGGG